MIHSICKEHDWVKVEKTVSCFQCRNCGKLKESGKIAHFFIPENLEVIANDESVFNAEKYYKNEGSNKL